MRRRVEAKLYKAIRRAEHSLPGLQRSLSRRGASQVEALCRLAVDPAEKWDHRKFVADLIWSTPGAKAAHLTMIRLVTAAGKTSVAAAYLRLGSDRTNIEPAELALFREVLAQGSQDEQWDAIDGIAFIQRRSVERALIEVIFDTAVLLTGRERATEMLHLHNTRRAAEACAKALTDSSVGIRFWAAYSLGQSHGKIREFAVPALEKVLRDEAVAPGWWSVGKEAQAAIVGLRDDPAARERLQKEIQRIRQDPNASPEDQRWAAWYDNSNE